MRSTHRLNRVCHIFSQSVQGLQSSDTPKLALSHWLSASPLQQCTHCRATLWFNVLSPCVMFNEGPPRIWFYSDSLHLKHRNFVDSMFKDVHFYSDSFVLEKNIQLRMSAAMSCHPFSRPIIRCSRLPLSKLPRASACLHPVMDVTPGLAVWRCRVDQRTTDSDYKQQYRLRSRCTSSDPVTEWLMT